MHRTYYIITILVFFLNPDYCIAFARIQDYTLNTVMKELHAMYKEAFENENPHITRRIFSQDGRTHYSLHVQKLREVNGLKTHNLRLIGRSGNETPIVYINNPIEAEMPNAFLQLDQFKSAMFNHAAREKKEFNIKRNFLMNAIRLSNSLKQTNRTSTTPIQMNKADFHNFAVDLINEVNNKIKKEVNGATTKKATKKVKRTALNATKKAAKKVKKTALNKRKRRNKRRKRRRRRRSTTNADKKRTTKTTTDESTTTGTTADEKTTTGTTADEETTTGTTADEEESTTDEETTTGTTADEEESTTDEETTTESTTRTTTETTVKKKRTKQSRPYVFLGDE